MGALFKIISSIFFAKFMEESVRHFSHRLMNYSAGNRFTQFSQKYTNTINNVEVKVKNYIFILGLMLMAVFLVVIGILSLVLSLALYLFSYYQLALPFAVFGLLVILVGIALVMYSQRALNINSPKSNLKY